MSALSSSNGQRFWLGALHIIPLCLAVFPWGVLTGSMAVSQGFTPLQSIGLSVFLFAGAAQLVTISMVAAGSGFVAICLTILVITAQHLLYALILREHVSSLPLKKRLPVAFLLTDELFALSVGKKSYDFAYLMGAGLCFYLAWIGFTLIGVVLAASVPNLADYHLDFSIVATFIAIVVPMIKRLSSLVGVVIALTLSLVLSSLAVPGAIVIAGLLGMLCAVGVARWRGEAL
ncbi:MAG: AzlC family ABC transporter permease [Pseudomonas sp.]|jgi:4-azaleucine resistance transporter AzlC|nr:AzlC family ABC transporter permease [Pseudomonas sp.]MDD2223816.1 AzlC family ABC transporter permease [Pseudomonas sp.]MDY0415918.1 AzlC family ABC transporter permease [Pseudomonas sp.]NLO53423.1 AzlC family ABC transporter permease [Gammaproteobacteria bacterium]